MIEQFEFMDRDTGWELQSTRFDAVNLLVGVSGAGKSTILTALLGVAESGVGRWAAPPNCAWKLRLRASGQTFEWEAQTSATNERIAPMVHVGALASWFEFGQRTKKGKFLEERVWTSSGQMLAERHGEQIKFAGSVAPKLKETESLISLFQQEETIAPLFAGLSHVFKSNDALQMPAFSTDEVAPFRGHFSSIEQLRRDTRLPLIIRLDLLQTLDPTAFAEIVSAFTEIFPSVTTVRVGPAGELLRMNKSDDAANRLVVAVEEEGVELPILLQHLSSGMARTLRHLVELALAPSGSTILIDEYENSLGVNCLPAITRHLLGRIRDVQLIATSHHPYVINHIDPKCWRVVTRLGSKVRVLEVADIPELNTGSRQEAFVRLINSEAYQHGAGGA
ncbi:MAG: ATP-binding protein [Polyangiaceae bacterium]|nr:ATP-binding protein [Polyangiaceae bacterium]